MGTEVVGIPWSTHAFIGVEHYHKPGQQSRSQVVERYNASKHVNSRLTVSNTKVFCKY
jgi:hypothetical protein